MAEHEHQWRMHTHVDGCHFWQSIYLCDECGAIKAVAAERNFHDPDDPYAAVWVIDACTRCQQLLKGDKPKVLT